MESSFFQITGIDSPELEQDLKVLQQLSIQQLTALQRFLSDDDRIIQRDESMRDELQEMLTANEISGEAYARARRFLRFFVEACGRYDDELSAIVHDLVRVYSVQKKLASFLNGFSDAVDRALTTQRRRQLAKQSLPALTGVEYTCDVRVGMPEFDVFKEDPQVRSAKPQDWIPVVILRFATDEDDELRSQVDLTHLQRAINVLRAAERDLIQIRDEIARVGLINGDKTTDETNRS